MKIEIILLNCLEQCPAHGKHSLKVSISLSMLMIMLTFITLYWVLTLTQPGCYGYSNDSTVALSLRSPQSIRGDRCVNRPLKKCDHCHHHSKNCHFLSPDHVPDTILSSENTVSLIPP